MTGYGGDRPSSAGHCLLPKIATFLLNCQLFCTGPLADEERSPICLQVRGKAMANKAGDMLEVARDILLTARLDDKARFTQMVNETKAGMEASEWLRTG